MLPEKVGWGDVVLFYVPGTTLAFAIHLDQMPKANRFSFSISGTGFETSKDATETSNQKTIKLSSQQVVFRPSKMKRETE